MMYDPVKSANERQLAACHSSMVQKFPMHRNCCFEIASKLCANLIKKLVEFSRSLGPTRQRMLCNARRRSTTCRIYCLYERQSTIMGISLVMRKGLIYRTRYKVRCEMGSFIKISPPDSLRPSPKTIPPRAPSGSQRQSELLKTECLYVHQIGRYSKFYKHRYEEHIMGSVSWTSYVFVNIGVTVSHSSPWQHVPIRIIAKEDLCQGSYNKSKIRLSRSRTVSPAIRGCLQVLMDNKLMAFSNVSLWIIRLGAF